jgi:hypothetical protein
MSYEEPELFLVLGALINPAGGGSMFLGTLDKGITSQKTIHFMIIAVRTSNPAFIRIIPYAVKSLTFVICFNCR